MKRVLIAVALAGMLSAGSGCCSCLHEAAAWRKSWAAPHVCGHSYAPFGHGCCSCGCDTCTNQSGCESCGGGCESCGGGCGGHTGWLGRWATDGGVDRCDPCCDDGCWDHGRCDHCGEACDDDCSMWLADDWGRGCGGGCASGGGCGGACGGGDCCPCAGGCCNQGCGHNGHLHSCLAELNPFNWFGGCKGGGCGKFYWNEWFCDPPCCYDPCNCCGDYTGQVCDHGTACGGCSSCGGGISGGGYVPGPSYSTGPGYGMRPRGTLQHAGTTGQPKQIESYVMRQPRQAAAAPQAQRTSDMPFTIQSNLGGTRSATPRSAVRPTAPAPRTSSKPTGKTSSKIAHPPTQRYAMRNSQPAQRRQVTAPQTLPSQEGQETVVEGSLKVVEDRAVQPAAGLSTERGSRSTPPTAKRRVRATRTTMRGEPTT